MATIYVVLHFVWKCQKMFDKQASSRRLAQSKAALICFLCRFSHISLRLVFLVLPQERCLTQIATVHPPAQTQTRLQRTKSSAMATGTTWWEMRRTGQDWSRWRKRSVSRNSSTVSRNERCWRGGEAGCSAPSIASNSDQ